MKKIFLIVLLALISISASARKSYITVWAENVNGAASSSNGIILTGDVPDDIEGFEYYTSSHTWNSRHLVRTYSTGEILNVLSEYGYEVEFVTNDNKNFLLSKEIPDGQTLTEGDVNKDGEVTIADINRIVNIILGIVRDNPSLLKQYGK